MADQLRAFMYIFGNITAMELKELRKAAEMFDLPFTPEHKQNDLCKLLRAQAIRMYREDPEGLKRLNKFLKEVMNRSAT
jgi:hypothetical protein